MLRNVARRNQQNWRTSQRRLFLESLESRSLLAVVTGIDPPANAVAAPRDAELTITFDEAISADSASATTILVHGEQSGLISLTADFSVANGEVTLNPADDFFAGEPIQATVTTGVVGAGGENASPLVWQFRAAATTGGGLFQDANQAIGDQLSLSVALADLDGDGDLDAFVANRAAANRVWWNEEGLFVESGQSLGDHESFGVALGDVDGDGDLDAFVANLGSGNRVWLNDGGRFTDSGQSMGIRNSLDVALGDLDGDGDLDALVANGLQGNRLYQNDGNGLFTGVGRYLGNSSSNAVALGDLDGDGDLDAFVANSYQPNRIWLNDGGTLSDSGQSLGAASSRDVSLADLDGDGDLDAFVANSNQPNRVWFNDGGVFADSEQELGNQRSYGVSLGDLDSDGDLDAFVANASQGNRIWLNEAGVFSDSGQELAGEFSYGVSLGDVDSDGDLDAFVANFGPNRVWTNLNPTFSVQPPSPLPEGGSGVTPFAFTVVRQFDTRGAATVDYEFVLSGPVPAQLADFAGDTLPSGTLSFADGVATQVVAIDVVGDEVVELDETFSLVLSNPQGEGAVLGRSVGQAVIRNDEGNDLGDLPSSLQTSLLENGPAHIAVGPLLGTARDIEPDGLPSIEANGDDLVGGPDDEDGVQFQTTLFAGQLAGEVTVTASEAARLDGWIDFNADGSFDSAGERIFAAAPLEAGENRLLFPLPAWAQSANLFARFRVSSAGGLAPGGGAADGEVEDYLVAVASPGGSAVFGDSQQSLGNHSSLAVELGDLDGDGDLDAAVANGYGEPNRIWWNDQGRFTDSGQLLGNQHTSDLKLGDFDGDGDLDLMTANSGGNRVWINTGGTFTSNGQSLGGSESNAVALGDLDRDGDLDAFVANADQGNRVWLNNGSGVFETDGQVLGNHSSRDVALGDLDGDGDLDAFVTSYDQPNRIWSNERGQFTDSGQQLGDHRSWGVALGDLDGDGDLDAFVANVDQPARTWLNQGGRFASDQTLGDHFGFDVALGDLDGDGDLDAMMANGDAGNPRTASSGNRVLLNEGGSFRDFGQPLGDHVSFGIALGDLDGDGDLDAFSANYYQPNVLLPRSGQANRVWLNIEDETLISIRAMEAEKPEGDDGTGTFEFEVRRLGNTDVAGSVTYAVSGVGAAAANAADFGGSFPAGVLEFAAGETSKTITIEVTGDTDVELDETFLVELSEPQPSGARLLQATASGMIQNDDLTPITLFLTVENPLVVENSGIATFTAILSSVASEEITVELELSGTATEGEDYVASATQIVIPAGQLSGAITVTAVQDDIAEDPETVTVEVNSVTNASLGTPLQTATIVDDDQPPALYVTSLLANESMVTAFFSTRIAVSPLNLFDAERAGKGEPDLLLVGEASGPVRGSLVVHPSRTSVTFIKSGGPLEPDTYLLTLRSGEQSFFSEEGGLLDGDNDGLAGDDHLQTLVIPQKPADVVTVRLPDFARGPGQPVNLPADSELGIPLTISGAPGVRSVDLRLDVDSDLLEISSIELGDEMPFGSTVQLSTAFGGSLQINFRAGADLPGGTHTLATLNARVPTVDAAEHYGRTHLLDMHLVSIRDSNDNELPVVVDNALHVANYLGDVSGNGRLNASDAARVARIAALLDTGFADSLLVDPHLVGDVSGNGRINSGDASLIAQAASLLPVPEIPPIPSGVLAAAANGETARNSTDLAASWNTPEHRPRIGLDSDDTLHPWSQPSEIHDAALEEYLAE